MEKDVALGKIGGLKLDLAAGKVSVAIEAKEAALDGAVSVEASVKAQADAGAFVDMLFALIESKSPAGAAPLEEAVKMVIKNAVLAIG